MTDFRGFMLTAKNKGKKGKGGDAAKRSRFLGVVMKHLAGDAGKEMANAIEAKDLEKFKTLWGSATSIIFKSLEDKFKGSDNAASTPTPAKEVTPVPVVTDKPAA